MRTSRKARHLLVIFVTSLSVIFAMSCGQFTKPPSDDAVISDIRNLLIGNKFLYTFDSNSSMVNRVRKVNEQYIQNISIKDHLTDTQNNSEKVISSLQFEFKGAEFDGDVYEGVMTCELTLVYKYYEQGWRFEGTQNDIAICKKN